ncbi:MAG: 8-oxoguanine deaminase [Candidatus Marinimicrobia bacterium]|nr:8-oxoguanine deaminase [Candidatus Neomarinimicrobiota bacterium]MCF7840103.1 8-oxoguanine deaminase [Candidatus Neomarinimicrobiota bacterium]MCF7902887.1 8-oxoguanine deaminase [Candidatus Neomarinimicrobiota bacterium]
MSPKRILIKNPKLVATMDDQRREFSGGHILIENGVITSLGPNPLDVRADEVIDASEMVALPGFINTHHHLYQSLTRNIPRMQDQPLFSWLKNHYQLWRELTEEGVFVSAQVGLLELMKSGTTTSSDHLYLFPKQAGKQLIDAEINAARQLGIRFQPTRGSMTLGESAGGLPPDDVVQDESVILADIKRLLAKYHDTAPGAMTRLALAPCSPFSVTTEQMAHTAAFAAENDLRIHTHLAETLDEEKFCIQQFGMRPVDYMESVNWVGENAWYAHAIHLNNDEVERLGSAGTGVSHCPSSNMRLGSGIARIRELLDAGVRVSLGVDGTASNDSGNMLMEIRNALYLSRMRDQGFWLTARDVFWMATRGGAAVLGRDDIGELSPGKQADIALFRIDGLEYAGAQSDPLAALAFTVRMGPVDYLLVNGEVRIRDGNSRMVEGELIASHNRLAAEMLARAAQHTGIDFLHKE